MIGTARDLNGDTSLHHQLHGQEIDYVATNGEVLVLRTKNGKELRVAWVNENGEAIKGKPVLMFCGLNVKASTAKLFGTAAKR
jgi:hypothetical protein